MPENDRKIWERYSRQVLFAPIGRAGQEKLLNSRVAVIGYHHEIEAAIEAVYALAGY